MQQHGSGMHISGDRSISPMCVQQYDTLDEHSHTRSQAYWAPMRLSCCFHTAFT